MFEMAEQPALESLEWAIQLIWNHCPPQFHQQLQNGQLSNEGRHEK